MYLAEQGLTGLCEWVQQPGQSPDFQTQGRVQRPLYVGPVVLQLQLR